LWVYDWCASPRPTGQGVARQGPNLPIRTREAHKNRFLPIKIKDFFKARVFGYFWRLVRKNRRKTVSWKIKFIQIPGCGSTGDFFVCGAPLDKISDWPYFVIRNFGF
jgi:hypothetical protein